MRRSYLSRVREWWSQWPEQDKEAMTICGGLLAAVLTLGGAGAIYFLYENRKAQFHLDSMKHEIASIVEQYDCESGYSAVDSRMLLAELALVVPPTLPSTSTRLQNLSEQGDVDGLLKHIKRTYQAEPILERIRRQPSACLVTELEQRVKSYDGLPGLSLADQMQLARSLGWGAAGIPPKRTLDIDSLSKAEVERALQAYRTLEPRPRSEP